MFAHITKLQYWKSEHSEETCQDKLLGSISTGLFAVADGASTSSYPQLWADVLVKHFLEVPLLSAHLFEIDWWVRMAQERYVAERPKLEMLTPLAREKESTQGSESTLVALRLVSVEETSGEGEILVFGDSCVLIGRPDTQQMRLTFPLTSAADFDRRPICLPSNPGTFSRAFHRCEQLTAPLTAGDVVLLATDAVSRWIIGKGGGQYQEMWAAFEAVARRTPGADWEAFIQQQRHNKTMVDDDCTVLMIELQGGTSPTILAGSQAAAQETGELGFTPQKHQQQVIDGRLQRFEQAKKEQNRELEAIYYGDGADLVALLAGQITLEEIEHARQVSDALRAVISASTANYKKPDFAVKMREIWEHHKGLLENEPCAEGIKNTLRANGVFSPTVAFTLPGNQQSASPVQAALPAPAVPVAALPPAPPVPVNALPGGNLPGSSIPPMLPPAGYGAAGSLQMERDQGEEAIKWSLQAAALAEFRRAVESQRIEVIGPAYERIQQMGVETLLAPGETKQGAFALSLTQALAQQQDEVLAAAHQALLASGYDGFFRLLPEERERLLEAQEVVVLQRDPTAVVEIVNEWKITAGYIRQVKSLRRLYIQLRMREDEQSIATDPAKGMDLRLRIEQWRAELKSPKRFHEMTVEEIIDDAFIMEPLHQEMMRREGFFDFILTSELDVTYQAMNTLLGPGNYANFLSEQGLARDTAWYILTIFVRRSRFRTHFRMLSNAPSFDEWLQQERVQKKISRKDAAAGSAPKKFLGIF